MNEFLISYLKFYDYNLILLKIDQLYLMFRQLLIIFFEF